MASLRPGRSIAALAPAFPLPARAFHDVAAGPTASPAWTLEPWLLALLLASAILYAAGVRSLWRHAGSGRGLGSGDAVRFAAGWSVMALALVSPLDALAGQSFALHMVQHELLMVVAAPLLVLGRPLEAWAWAMPRVSQGIAGAMRASRVLAPAWRALTGMQGAWLFHATAIWAWHVPAIFQAALADNAVHLVQHVSFFASALAFWWSVLGRRAPTGPALASVFATMLHTGALGAILTFAPTPWYAAAASGLGITAIEDQQLGGLVMWAPGGLAYLVAALALTARLVSSPPPPRLRTAG